MSCVEAGFSLVEAVVAAAIAAIAVLGLAYTFGVGRGMVNRYELARAALGVAQDRLEMCTGLPLNSDSLLAGYTSPQFPFVYEAQNFGNYSWNVTGFDHPNIPGTVDLKRVTVTVRFRNGSGTDSLRLDRLIALP
ncbi:MAG: hypothetical protein U0704_00440 [Candidatus Eisenbacteria bacterium]